MGKKKTDRGHHVCPWYMAYLFDNPLRRLIHDPARILGPYVAPGDTVLDMGCGMGFFTLGMARLVGPAGKVIALDLQKPMLKIVERRARRKGLYRRIETRLVGEEAFPLAGTVDFVLCFWMVHEVPDQGALFRDLHRTLRPGGKVLVAEPGRHVQREDLEGSLTTATREGFTVTGRPGIRMCHSAVLEKKP